jgi:hypothetical protein
MLITGKGQPVAGIPKLGPGKAKALLGLLAIVGLKLVDITVSQ